jgi:two-component system, LytTR family, response regulator LytT
MKILLIEDDRLLSLKYQMMIEEFGHTILANCKSVEEAQVSIAQNPPDLIVSDIMLGNRQSFELGAILQKIPTVFMTSFSEEEIQERAMQFPKSLFLVKPFHSLSLKSAIERLTTGFVEQQKSSLDKESGIEVIGKHRQKRIISFKEIHWIETQGNYSTLNTIDKKYSLKVSLRKIQEQLPKDFVQVHKAYIINLKFINRLDLGQGIITINGSEIPLGRNFKKEFLEAYNTVR